MDVIEIARTALRRWYVVLAVLLLTGVAAVAVARTAEVHYEVSGSFLLSAVSAPDAEGADRDVATLTPHVASELVQDSDVRARVGEQGGSDDYTVTVEGDGLLRVQGAGASEEEAVTTAQLVMAEIRSEVTRHEDEAGAPENRRTEVEVLSSPTTARLVGGGDVPADGADVGDEAYVATGSLRFLTPPGAGSNPYAASLVGTVRVLEEVLQSPIARREIAAAGGDPGYELGMLPADAAPIVNVVTTSTSAEVAERTFGLVEDGLRDELETRQDEVGAPEASWLNLEPLSVPVGAVVVGGELQRSLIVIIGVGVVAAVSLAVVVEAGASRRRSRHELDAPPTNGKPISASGPLTASRPPRPDQGVGSLWMPFRRG